jgi:hypothetical protein
MAEETVAATQIFTWTFFVLVFLVIIAILLIVFFIRRLKYKADKILKSIAIALIITLAVELAYFIIGKIFGLFMVICKTDGYCPSQFQTFLSTTIYSGPVVFLVSLLAYYLFKYFKK